MASPAVMREFFQQALRIRGQVIQLHHRPTIINCPCYNTTYQTADPNCDVCNGTGMIGGYQAEAAATFVAAVFLDPEMRQDQHQRLVTRVGPVETLDGRMYCEAKWFQTIRITDIITFKSLGETTGTEMQIIAKHPRLGGNGEIVYVRCDLEKQPFRLRTDATDLKPLV